MARRTGAASGVYSPLATPERRDSLNVSRLDERLYHACSSDVSGTGPAEKLHFLSFVVEEGLSISDSVKYLLQNESH